MAARLTCRGWCPAFRGLVRPRCFSLRPRHARRSEDSPRKRLGIYSEALGRICKSMKSSSDTSRFFPARRCWNPGLARSGDDNLERPEVFP